MTTLKKQGKKLIEEWLLKEGTSVHINVIATRFDLEDTDTVKATLHDSEVLVYNALTSKYVHVWTKELQELKRDADGTIVHVRTWAERRKTTRPRQFADYAAKLTTVFHVFRGGGIRGLTPLNVASKTGLLAALAEHGLRGVDLDVAVCEYREATDDIRALESEGRVIVLGGRVWATGGLRKLSV